MKFDHSIIGEKNGKKLIAAIKSGRGPDQLSLDEIAFLQYPESSTKQREFAAKMVTAIERGELRATRGIAQSKP